MIPFGLYEHTVSFSSFFQLRKDGHPRNYQDCVACGWQLWEICLRFQSHVSHVPLLAAGGILPRTCTVILMDRSFLGLDGRWTLWTGLTLVSGLVHMVHFPFNP